VIRGFLIIGGFPPCSTVGVNEGAEGARGRTHTRR
jgi:hypothetical protein